jgi:hypothetical protein
LEKAGLMKVLGFDSWTRGSHHFSRLVEALAKRDIELSVLHLGSWGNDKNQEPDYHIGKLRMRDISSYGGLSLSAILDHERPDVVIFLSTETFAHRAFNRLCAQKDIPTVHLYHGVTSVFYGDDGDENVGVSLRQALRRVFEKASKTIIRTLPAYSKTLLFTRARPAEWVRFVADIFRLSAGKNKFVASVDSRTTACCVYVDGDVSHAMEKYGFDRSRVHVVGNPDLGVFDLTESMLGVNAQTSGDIPGDVMYIETGFHVLTAGGEKDYIAHLSHTRERLAAQGRAMLFKSKPSVFTSTLAASLEELGIEVIDNDSFVDRLQRCSASLVEFTSLALFPAFLGLPVFLIDYGYWAGTRFGTSLKTYPRSIPLDDLDRFNELLQAERASCRPEQVRAWIRENVGPLPAEDMPERVADVIAGLAADHVATR